MKTMWIEQAMGVGGKLSVKRCVGSPVTYQAMMEWRTHYPIDGLGLTIESAIESLNEALMEDAADEMVKKGVV